MVERVRSAASTRRIMRDFTIEEISGVDVPAQGHAKVTLMKRADAQNILTKDDMCSPAEVAVSVHAMDFDSILAENEARETAQSLGAGIREKWWAFQHSLATIAADGDVDAADKIAAMRISLQQFVSSLSAESATLAADVTKSLTAVPALAGLLTAKGVSEGEEPMTELEKKQLDELSKKVADLTKQLEAASASDTAKHAAALQGELTAATAKLDDMSKKLEAADLEKAEAITKASMSDAEKSYMDTLDAKAKMDFMRMTPADRAKSMKKSFDADPVVYKSEATGQEFRKSDDPRLVDMAKRADENEKLFKAELEKRETAEFAKRVDTELKHFSGTVDEKVAVLRAVSKVDESARDALMKMLDAGNKAIGAAFQTIGHDREAVRKSADSFAKRVDEIISRDKISRDAAMTKARELYPDEFKAYQGN